MCPPLLGSATDDPVQSARESFAPTTTMACERKGEYEMYFFPCSYNVFAEKTGGIRKSNRQVFIYLPLSYGIAAMMGRIFPSPEYQQAGRGKGRSKDGRACRSRYRR